MGIQGPLRLHLPAPGPVRVVTCLTPGSTGVVPNQPLDPLEQFPNPPLDPLEQFPNPPLDPLEQFPNAPLDLLEQFFNPPLHPLHRPFRSLDPQQRPVCGGALEEHSTRTGGHLTSAVTLTLGAGSSGGGRRCLCFSGESHVCDALRRVGFTLVASSHFHVGAVDIITLTWTAEI